MTTSSPFAHSGAPRDPRLDVFRGLALITIFINHVPGNLLENFTSRNFGLSDAAEGFVYMSGIAVALAYFKLVQAGHMHKAFGKLMRRAGKLYVWHILGTLVALAMIAVTWFGFGVTEFGERLCFSTAVEQPFDALVIGLPLLAYQVGYYNILPLYIVFLVLAPGLLWLGVRSIALMLMGSTALWIASRYLGLNFPNHPLPGGWFMHPLGWQLLFALGLATGIAKKQGRALVAFSPWLFAAAIGWLVWSYLHIKGFIASTPGHGTLPAFLTDVDKSPLALPRVLHLLSLVYVLVHTPLAMTIARSAMMVPVARMGRNGLELFAFGSIMAIGLQAVFAVVPSPAWVVSLAIVSGVFIQFALAIHLDGRKPRTAKTQAGDHQPVGVPA